jgi:hypothetical protein
MYRSQIALLRSIVVSDSEGRSRVNEVLTTCTGSQITCLALKRSVRRLSDCFQLYALIPDPFAIYRYRVFELQIVGKRTKDGHGSRGDVESGNRYNNKNDRGGGGEQCLSDLMTRRGTKLAAPFCLNPKSKSFRSMHNSHQQH